MAVQWLDNINCNIYFNSSRLMLLFQYKFNFSMFKAISSSYVNDFYWVCVAIDVKSENITLQQSKIIGEHTCFLELSCKFYWVFSVVTFAQIHKFIRTIQILRYYTNIAVKFYFSQEKYLLLECMIFYIFYLVISSWQIHPIKSNLLFHEERKMYFSRACI